MSLSSANAGHVDLQHEEEEDKKITTNDLQDVAATPLSQISVTIPAGDPPQPPEQEEQQQQQDTQSVLDQHEDDVTQFLNNYTQSARVLDQFDVTRALIQSSQGSRVNTPPPPPPPPPETYEALLSGQPPGRKSPALPIQTTTNRMLFGKNDKALSNRRRLFATTTTTTNNASSDYEADLSSSDKIKAQQSVMRFLRDKIRTDWEYSWPRPAGENTDTEYEFDDDVVADWCEREDWESGISDDDEENRLEDPAIATAETEQADVSQEVALKSITNGSPPKTPIRGVQEPVVSQDKSPFRFETPEKVGEVVKQKMFDKKERRRKRRLDMESWNPGLKCWNQRRDAWTCARKIPASSSIPQDNSKSPTSNGSTNQDSTSSNKGKSKELAIRGKEDPPCSSRYPVIHTYIPITQIPIAHPLIPPENVIRSQVAPSNYGVIYEKVVTMSITPKCTINLKDMTRACVEGWKRDGEWPPRPSAPEASIARKGGISRMKLNGLLGRGRRESGGSSAVGQGDAGRRGSLASALGLDKVRSVFGRRGSGSVGRDPSPSVSNTPNVGKEGDGLGGEVDGKGKGKA